MFIQNVSMKDIKTGRHYDAGNHSLLIQIVDPAYEFPTPHDCFKACFRFEFLDAEEDDDMYPDEAKITDEQAKRIVELLQYALVEKMNVIVHCHAGVCRSGAVAEVGVMMGFTDTGVYRLPNVMVKTKMMKALGWTYE